MGVPDTSIQLPHPILEPQRGNLFLYILVPPDNVAKIIESPMLTLLTRKMSLPELKIGDISDNFLNRVFYFHDNKYSFSTMRVTFREIMNPKSVLLQFQQWIKFTVDYQDTYTSAYKAEHVAKAAWLAILDHHLVPMRIISFYHLWPQGSGSPSFDMSKGDAMSLDITFRFDRWEVVL